MGHGHDALLTTKYNSNNMGYCTVWWMVMADGPGLRMLYGWLVGCPKYPSMITSHQIHIA